MGVKFITETQDFTASVHARHPKTRKPKSKTKRGFKTEAQAQRALKKMLLELHESFNVPVVPTWLEVAKDCLEFRRLRGISTGTLYSEEMCLQKYTYRNWGPRSCDSITRAEILSCVMDGMNDKADSHKKYFLKVLRTVFTYAVDQGYVASNPTPLLKFRMGEKIKPVLTKDRAGYFLERAWEMNSEWYSHWAMALYTGMRNGELYALKWDVVDLENGKIKVCRSWNCHDGFKDTKSGDDRIIDIAPALKPVLQDLYATRMTEFVLPRLYKWDKGEQARDLRAFLLGMGLPAIRFHDLRATWATILLGQGIEPVKVMKMGGWKDLDTMMIYCRKAGIDVDGALNGLTLHQHRPQIGEVLQLKKSPGSNL